MKILLIVIRILNKINKCCFRPCFAVVTNFNAIATPSIIPICQSSSGEVQ